MTDEPKTEGPPWWCETCRSWRHTMPCGRDDCPCPTDAVPVPPEIAHLTGEDVDQIIEGIEHFCIGCGNDDAELDAAWRPYIDKLNALKAAPPGAPEAERLKPIEQASPDRSEPIRRDLARLLDNLYGLHFRPGHLDAVMDVINLHAPVKEPLRPPVTIPPHQFTPDATKQHCLVCGDGAWGIHRFQAAPGSTPTQEEK